MRQDARSSWSLIGVILLASAACSPVPYGNLVARAAPPAEEELLLTLGPVDLSPDLDHFDAPQPIPLHATFPRDGWARGFAIELVDASGEAVPFEVLHHVKVIVPGKRELLQPISLRLLGAGSETRSGRLADGLGIPVLRGDSILATAMVHNPSARDLRGVRIHLRLQYVPADASPRITEVQPFFLHATPPGEPSDYDLPPGYSEQSWEAHPAVEARILALGAHLHRYGLHVRLEDATTGREIWRATPQFDEEGALVGMPRKQFVWTRGPLLRPDRTYRVTAAYHNPTGDTIKGGGMGTIAGAVRPVGPWPEPDTGHPVYVTDLLRELSGDHGHGSDGTHHGSAHGHAPGHSSGHR